MYMEPVVFTIWCKRAVALARELPVIDSDDEGELDVITDVDLLETSPSKRALSLGGGGER